MSLKNYLDGMENRILKNEYSMKKEVIQNIETQLSKRCINDSKELYDFFEAKADVIEKRLDDFSEKLGINSEKNNDKQNAIYEMMIDSRKSETDACCLLNQMKDIELNICQMMEDSRKSEADIIEMLESVLKHDAEQYVFTSDVDMEDDLLKYEAKKIIQSNMGERRFEETRINFANMEWIIPDIASYIAQLEEIFIDEVYKFETEKEVPIVYDCGSNVGTSIFYFKHLYPRARVVGFEADPNIFRYLENNVGKLCNVEISNAAIWTENGKINFGCQGADGGSLVNSFDSNVQVDSVRLRDYLEKEDRVDFLKIDIEGAETDVLKDCENCLGKVENIFIEYHSISSEKQTLDVLLKILSDNGYRYYIEGLYHKRKSPIINRQLNCNMDLQVSIWAKKE